MKRLTIEVVFDIGEIVYITTDSDQAKYVVLAYVVHPDYILYEVYSHSYGTYKAYDFELSKNKDVTMV